MGAPPKRQKRLPRSTIQQSPSPPPLQQPASPSPPTKRRKPRTPLTSPLPSLRLLLHPRPGLGIDIRLPLSYTTRCYMQLESLFNGPSTIRIGLHPRNHPAFRCQLSPTPNLSLRLPIRINGSKYLHLGLCASAKWGMDTDCRRWEWGMDRNGWRVGPVVEIWRYTTAAAMVDRGVKQGLKQVLERKPVRGFDGSALDDVPVDPRERDDLIDVLKDVLRERNRVRARFRDGAPISQPPESAG